METKVAPGPWEHYKEIISAGSDHKLIFQTVRDSTGKNIARLNNVETAHLIASAPEMFQVLQDVLDALTDGGRHIFTEGQNDYHVGAIKRVLKKALNEKVEDEKV